MQIDTRQIDFAPQPLESRWHLPAGYRPGESAGVVLAHGAGAGMDHPFMATLAESLADAGLLCVRFNFPYMSAGRRAPDRAPTLLRAWHAMAQAVAGDALAPRTLVLGGKSMGARYASMLAAEGATCDGVLAVGYPLHPARKPEKLRVAHLPQVRQPMLFLQGDRDTLCDLALLREHLRKNFTLHVVPGADHGFGVLKRSGRTPQDVMQELVRTSTQWISTVNTTAPSGTTRTTTAPSA